MCENVQSASWNGRLFRKAFEQSVGHGLAWLMKSAALATEEDSDEPDAMFSPTSATLHYNAALQCKQKALFTAQSVVEGIWLQEWIEHCREFERRAGVKFQSMLDAILHETAAKHLIKAAANGEKPVGRYEDQSREKLPSILESGVITRLITAKLRDQPKLNATRLDLCDSVR